MPSQTSPAALVLEFADHLEQFVGVVVDPARGGAAPGLRFLFGERDLLTGSGGFWAGRLVRIVDPGWRLGDGHSHNGNRNDVQRFRFESFPSIFSFIEKVAND